MTDKPKSGTLRIVGLGPGDPEWLTIEAARVLDFATDIVGYGPYLARAPRRANQRFHASDNREEMARARLALRLTEEGRSVALASGGDPGVFAMAAAVFEAIETGEAAWRTLDVAIAPGVSAMFAAAARLGAPLGHDFCAISLSDNLKPWEIVARRLRAACAADFVIALYNPASRARPRRIHDAFGLLRELKDPATPIVFARAVGRSDEAIVRSNLASADPDWADMSTLILIGSSATRWIARPNAAEPWLYTPRAYSRDAS